MKWITEDGSIQVDAIFTNGELTIEGRIREGKDLTDAIKAAHQLVGYISKVYPCLLYTSLIGGEPRLTVGQEVFHD